MAQLQITVYDGPQPVPEGPDPILTELANRHVHAAFFCIGQEIHANPAATWAIHESEHVRGNHSWDHLEPHTSSYSYQIRDQFQRTHSEAVAATQVTMRHWRAPRLEQIQRLTGLLTTCPNHLYDLSHCDSQAESKDSQGASNSAQMVQAIRAVIVANGNRMTFRVLFHVKAIWATALPAEPNGLISDGHTFVDFAQVT